MHTIKVMNIPRWISEIHLKNYFNSCGKVIKSEIALDRDTLRSQGYGYVVFADEHAVQAALEKDGSVLDGSTLRVFQYDDEEVLV